MNIFCANPEIASQYGGCPLVNAQKGNMSMYSEEYKATLHSFYSFIGQALQLGADIVVCPDCPMCQNSTVVKP